MKYQIAFIAMFFLLFGAKADTPPGWEEFSVFSSNKRFMAKIVNKSPNKKPWKNQWMLQVHSNQTDKKLEWHTTFQHSGYSGGLLTNDGRYFVVVEFWFSPTSSQVIIYNRKAVKHIKGAQFNISSNKFRKTVSHQLWLAEDHTSSLIGNKEIAIKTIDGKMYRINLETGKFAH